MLFTTRFISLVATAAVFIGSANGAALIATDPGGSDFEDYMLGSTI